MKQIMNIIDKLINKEVTIKYDLRKNYTQCYNEAYGIAIKRKQLLKNPTRKCHSYTYYGFIYLWWTLLFHGITYILYKKIGFTPYIAILSSIVPILYFCIILYFLEYIIRIILSSYRKTKGTFQLSKNGLQDSTFNGIKILFEWSKIKMMVIGRHSITILTDVPIYFFVNKEIEEQVVKAIKKYKKDIIIVKNGKVM